MSKYQTIGRIDINEIKPVIEKKKIENKKIEEQKQLAEEQEEKTRRTKLANHYLEITDRDYILNKITDVDTINDDTIILKHDFYYHDLDITLVHKLRDLDVYHDQLICKDHSNSILDMIRNVIPEDYRLYAYYSKPEDRTVTFDIVLKRGSYWFNDPCCFYLLCRNTLLFNHFCYSCLIGTTGDCLADCYCGCCTIKYSGCCYYIIIDILIILLTIVQNY